MVVNSKGQALVEFVIILPVTLMLVFGIVDFGRVIYVKNNLENVNSDVVDLYRNGKTTEEIDNIINMNKKENVKISIDVRNEYTNIVVSSSIRPITPGLSLVASKVFDVKTERVIKNE